MQARFISLKPPQKNASMWARGEENYYGGVDECLRKMMSNQHITVLKRRVCDIYIYLFPSHLCRDLGPEKNDGVVFALEAVFPTPAYTDQKQISFV